MPVQERFSNLRREHQVNYGNTCHCVGGTSEPLFHMSQKEGRPFVVTVEALNLIIPDNVAATGDFRPYIHMAWGHGGADVEVDIEATYRQRIAVAASTVDVRAFVKSMPLAQGNGSFLQPPVPNTVQCDFRAMVSEGPDALPLFPTYWLTSMGTNKGNFVGPQGVGIVPGPSSRLASIRAFTVLAGESTGTDYLLLFDQDTVPVNGNVPIDAFPLNVNVAPAALPVGPMPAAMGQTRSFAKGLAWGISTTPYALTLDPNVTAFVSVELMC